MNKELIPSPNNRKAKTCPEPSRSIQNQGSLLPTIENPKSKIQDAMRRKHIHRATSQSFVREKPNSCASETFRLRKFVHFHRSVKPSGRSALPGRLHDR